MSYKPTVVFDFDGVIHSYVSGWKGADVILDHPVDGIREAIAKIRDMGYKVVVVSTRCSDPEGMGAVRYYLRKNEIVVDDVMAEKPPAVCYIDDRAICFDGDASTLPEKVKNFKNWVEQAKEAAEINERVIKEMMASVERNIWSEINGGFESQLRVLSEDETANITRDMKYCEEMFRKAASGDLGAMEWCFDQMNDKVQIARLCSLAECICETTGIPERRIVDIICKFDALEGGKLGFARPMGYFDEE